MSTDSVTPARVPNQRLQEVARMLDSRGTLACVTNLRTWPCVTTIIAASSDVGDRDFPGFVTALHRVDAGNRLNPLAGSR